MRCFVSSSYINAWSIRKGLRKLGLECHASVGGLGLVPSSAARPSPGDALFFTEEDTLKRFLSSGQAAEYHFYPRRTTIPPDDKLLFADALRDIGEQPVPYWPKWDAWPAEAVEYPVLVKCRHSWLGGQKLPRGYLCENSFDYESARQDAEARNLPPRLFFFQKFIPSPEVYATCGFFDHDDHSRNLIVVVRQVVGSGGHLKTGAAVEITDDPEQLGTRTARILDSLEYQGPFELEFLGDPTTGVLQVLELNMRFWMQHGLLLETHGNELLRRYLDWDKRGGRSGAPPERAAAVWFDLMALMDAIVLFRWRFALAWLTAYWSANRAGKVVAACPDPWTAVRFRARWYLFRLRLLARRLLPGKVG